MAFQDFINDFKKGIIGDALFFYGAEDFLMDWAVNQIVEKYIDESAREIDLQIIDGESQVATDVITAARSYSMLSDKRVVVVKNFLPIYKKNMDADTDELLDFCGKKNEATVLIFVLESKFESDITSFGKKLIKTCNSYEFAKLDKAALKSFINKRVNNAGKILGHKEIDYLIDLSGYFNKNSKYSLLELDRDLNKIIKASDENQINNQTIQDLLIGDEDKFVFNLVDALMVGNKNKAMKLAENIIREDDGSMSVLALLTKQFEIMYDSLQLSEKGMSIPAMAKKTGVNEFRFKKAYQAARNFTLDRIKKILIKMYNIDRDIKTGDIDRDVAFELLIVSI